MVLGEQLFALQHVMNLYCGSAIIVTRDLASVF